MDLPAIVSTWVSTAVMALLALGIYRRHTPRVHVPIMLVCFVLDLANVVFIEIGRGAVEHALSTARSGGEWILKFHIAVSILSLLGYGVALATGLRLLRTGRGRVLHRSNAVLFLLFRVLNYVTSFFV
jgi:hypothetical protein